jgi:hypothetical protein
MRNYSHKTLEGSRIGAVIPPVIDQVMLTDRGRDLLEAFEPVEGPQVEYQK